MFTHLITSILIITLFALPLSAQTELKKKEIEDRLIEIQSQIDAKEYEKAMDMLNSKTHVLLEENVPKKSFESYEQIRSTLAQKAALFKKNETIVQEFEQKYRDFKYCEAIDLLDLDLNKENSFQSTRQRIEAKRPKYEAAHAKCNYNKKQVQEWKRQYQLKNYETLYRIAFLSPDEQRYLYAEDYEDYTTLTRDFYLKRINFARVNKELVEDPAQLLEKIDYDRLSYKQSQQLISELTALLGQDAQIEQLEGNHPELKKRYGIVQKDIGAALEKLINYREALAPVNKQQVFTKVKSEEHLSLPFIETNCKKIENLGGSSFEDNKLFYLYDEDIFNYFHSDLSFLTTHEEKASYRQSDDYRQKEKALTQLREASDETIYYVELPEAFRFSHYDERTKSFKVQISADKGSSMFDAKPPQCVRKIDISQLDFDAEVSAGVKNDKLLVATDPQKIWEIEKNARDISLFFLFRISHPSQKVYKFSAGGDTKVIKDPVLIPSFLRVIAVNKKTGEQYYDKLFEFEVEKPVATAQVSEPVYRGIVNETAAIQASDISVGEFYALIIGIDNYSASWTPLGNAVNDARAIEQALNQYYKFDHFKTIYDRDATRANIIKGLEWLVNNVKENDNVLIYYSGHGDYNKALNKGYWVPVDATTNSISGFISNSEIQDFLQGINSKHTLLLADACFSGDIFRGSAKADASKSSEKYFNTIYRLKSRQAISSGGLEPVMDGGQDGHSVFAYYILQALRNNQSKYMDAEQLYSNIKVPVVHNSDQSPLFSPVKNTGDEGGQFIFIKK